MQETDRRLLFILRSLRQGVSAILQVDRAIDVLAQGSEELAALSNETEHKTTVQISLVLNRIANDLDNKLSPRFFEEWETLDALLAKYIAMLEKGETEAEQ